MICLAMATKLEAEPLFTMLKLKKWEAHPFPVFQNDNAILVLTGIGKVNAASAVTHVIQKFTPTVLINLGAAGATDGTSEERKTYQVDQVFDLNRPHFRSGTPYRFVPDTLPSLSSLTLGTRDMPVIDPDDRSNVSRISKLVDMEGSAISQVCIKFKLTHYLFKQVTDTPAHQTDKDIVKNIREYRDEMADYFINTIVPSLPNDQAK